MSDYREGKSKCAFESEEIERQLERVKKLQKIVNEDSKFYNIFTREIYKFIDFLVEIEEIPEELKRQVNKNFSGRVLYVMTIKNVIEFFVAWKTAVTEQEMKKSNSIKTKFYMYYSGFELVGNGAMSKMFREYLDIYVKLGMRFFPDSLDVHESDIDDLVEDFGQICQIVYNHVEYEGRLEKCRSDNTPN